MKNKNLTLSMLNKAWYWGITALRGSVSICTSVFSSRLCKGTTTGNRPTNSGIMPNSMRSLASTWRNNRSFSSMSWWVFDSPLRLARSAAAAALLPFPRLEGVPNPRYYQEKTDIKNSRKKLHCIKYFAYMPHVTFAIYENPNIIRILQMKKISFEKLSTLTKFSLL